MANSPENTEVNKIKDIQPQYNEDYITERRKTLESWVSECRKNPKKVKRTALMLQREFTQQPGLMNLQVQAELYLGLAESLFIGEKENPVDLDAFSLTMMLCQNAQIAATQEQR